MARAFALRLLCGPNSDLGRTPRPSCDNLSSSLGWAGRPSVC